jgi:hypothetical protein
LKATFGHLKRSPVPVQKDHEAVFAELASNVGGVSAGSGSEVEHAIAGVWLQGFKDFIHHHGRVHGWIDWNIVIKHIENP